MVMLNDAGPVGDAAVQVYLKDVNKLLPIIKDDDTRLAVQSLSLAVWEQRKQIQDLQRQLDDVRNATSRSFWKRLFNK